MTQDIKKPSRKRTYDEISASASNLKLAGSEHYNGLESYFLTLSDRMCLAAV